MPITKDGKRALKLNFVEKGVAFAFFMITCT